MGHSHCKGRATIRDNAAKQVKSLLGTLGTPLLRTLPLLSDFSRPNQDLSLINCCPHGTQGENYAEDYIGKLWRANVARFFVDRATRFMEGHCHKATQFVEGQSRSVCEGEKTIRVMEGQSRSVYGGSLKAARFGEF